MDELDEAFDAEVGERLDTVFANAIDPYASVLDLHFIGDALQPVFVFAEVPRNLGDGGEVMASKPKPPRLWPENSAYGSTAGERDTWLMI
ncbi:hypothetical protein IVA95_28375 [Bradyrhizobium sp. 157]|uniref:hypothetical protein n=1 Tax=Bradyrhizobium sp. 157 TaxID=2782631 RepID=UPI001FFAD9DD|nr:hypothetical protein [Bradyrhizobium sp. 157]